MATELADVLSLGDRIRVIPAAPSLTIQAETRADDTARAEELALPDRYVLAVGPFRHLGSLNELFEALAAPGGPAVPLVLVGTETMPFMDAAADSLATNLPRAEKRAIAASDHRWEPRTLALVIAEFLVG